jgi:broad specificity phosphatase PhoE
MYVLRHGQSEFNVHFSQTRIDPGIEDPRLTDLGHAQAAEAAERLAHHSIRRIVASPYTRALQTATPLAKKLGLPIEIDPLIREHAHFRCDIGTPAPDLRRAWPDIDFGDLPENWWPPKGESGAQLQARCAAFALRLNRATDWGEVVYVSHWAFIRGLTGLRVTNGTVVELTPGIRAKVVHSPET